MMSMMMKANTGHFSRFTLVSLEKQKRSRTGKYMNLSDKGSSHFPVSEPRSQFRAMVPSVRSVIIQRLNQSVAVHHNPFAARTALMMPMGRRIIEMELGWRGRKPRTNSWPLLLFVNFKMNMRSKANIPRTMAVMIRKSFMVWLRKSRIGGGPHRFSVSLLPLPNCFARSGLC